MTQRKALGVLFAALLLATAHTGAAEAAPADAAVAADACGPPVAGERCGPGNGRRTAGGGGKVSHKGWPAITGILWMVLDSAGHSRTGGPANDELLGHHGNDRIRGGGGRDVIWGDWNPRDNPSRQRDVLSGDAGDDRIYSSHGRNRIRGGPGNDYVWAYYGRGTIDCGRAGATRRACGSPPRTACATASAS
jgi:Ca2+-binding RTX toxin-like protein